MPFMTQVQRRRRDRMEERVGDGVEDERLLVVDLVGERPRRRASRSSAITEADDQLGDAQLVGRLRRLDRRGLDLGAAIAVLWWTAEPCAPSAPRHHDGQRHRPDRDRERGRPTTLPSVSTRRLGRRLDADLARAGAEDPAAVGLARTRWSEGLPAGQQRRAAAPIARMMKTSSIPSSARTPRTLRPGRHATEVGDQDLRRLGRAADPIEGDLVRSRCGCCRVSRIALARYANLPQRPFCSLSVRSITSASKPTPQATVKSRRLPPTVDPPDIDAPRPSGQRRLDRVLAGSVRDARGCRPAGCRCPVGTIAERRSRCPGQRRRDLQDRAVATDCTTTSSQPSLTARGGLPAHFALSPDDLVVRR